MTTSKYRKDYSQHPFGVIEMYFACFCVLLLRILSARLPVYPSRISLSNMYSGFSNI
jgi:hypothetical protein